MMVEVSMQPAMMSQQQQQQHKRSVDGAYYSAQDYAAPAKYPSYGAPSVPSYSYSYATPAASYSPPSQYASVNYQSSYNPTKPHY